MNEIEFNEKIEQIKDMYYNANIAYNHSTNATVDYYEGCGHAFRMALLILGVKKL